MLPLFGGHSMSGINQEQTNCDVGHADYSEADCILENLRALRCQIVTAWRERGVILSREEQIALQAEIKETCKFLIDLTHPL